MGSRNSSSAALGTGDTYTGEYTFDTLPAGNNQISFVLDAVEALEESNEGNNQCVLNINVVEGMADQTAFAV